MSWLYFSLATAIFWGTAELFYKKGADANEKYSHLKICICVGAVMCIHAIFTLLTQDINYNPINLLCYLPVSLLYIVSMAFSYFGMRYLAESISDPIENTSGAICSLMCIFILGDEPSPLSLIAIGIIVVGVLGVGYLENKGDTPRKKTFGKKLAIISFCMPFVYATLDAVGTFVDDAYFLDFESTHLIDVTEETMEAVANTSYELTFALFALCLFIFMKIKKVKFGPLPKQKDKILSGVFETAGQFTYVYALGESASAVVAAPIMSSTCIISLLLSRIVLKEKLSWKTYAFIGIVIIGILLLAIAEPE